MFKVHGFALIYIHCWGTTTKSVYHSHFLGGVVLKVLLKPGKYWFMTLTTKIFPKKFFLIKTLNCLDWKSISVHWKSDFMSHYSPRFFPGVWHWFSCISSSVFSRVWTAFPGDIRFVWEGLFSKSPFFFLKGLLALASAKTRLFS